MRFAFLEIGDVAVYHLVDSVAFLFEFLQIFQGKIFFVDAGIEVIDQFHQRTARDPAKLDVFLVKETTMTFPPGRSLYPILFLSSHFNR